MAAFDSFTNADHETFKSLLKRKNDPVTQNGEISGSSSRPLFSVLVAKSLHRATATDVKAPSVVSDFIHVEQLELLLRVGITETERAAPQRVTISITIWPRHSLVDLGDKLQNTVNYSKICDETKAFVRDHSYKLIETLADRLAAHLLKRFSMQRIVLELRKFVLPDTKFVAITISRTAAVG